MASKLSRFIVVILAFFYLSNEAIAAGLSCRSIFPSSRNIEQSISKFLEKIPSYSIKGFRGKDRIESRYYPLFLALSEVKFSTSKYNRITVDYGDGKKKKFVIDPRVVDGWTKLGMIDSAGFFNFSMDLNSILKNFSKLTGFKIVKSPSGTIDEVRYFSYIRRGEFFGDDIHSVLFHLAYLVDPVRRSTIQTAAKFVELHRKWFRNEGFYSLKASDLLNLYYEGPLRSQVKYDGLGQGETMLMGPNQTEFHYSDYRTIKVDTDPVKYLLKLEKAYEDNEVHFMNESVRFLEDRFDMKYLLLAMGFEVKAWMVAYSKAKGKSEKIDLNDVSFLHDSEIHQLSSLIRNFSKRDRGLPEETSFFRQNNELLEEINFRLSQFE